MATMKERRAALLDEAHTIINTAREDNDRELTDAEVERVKGLLDSADTLEENIARSERANAVMQRLNGTAPRPSRAPEAPEVSRRRPVSASAASPPRRSSRSGRRRLSPRVRPPLRWSSSPASCPPTAARCRCSMPCRLCGASRPCTGTCARACAPRTRPSSHPVR